MDVFLAAASVTLVFFAVLSGICAVELIRLARISPPIGAANERAVAAITAAIGAGIGGLLGVNRILGFGLDNNVAIALLVVAVALVGVPSVAWLYRYRRYLLYRGVAISFAFAVLAAAYLVVRFDG